MDHKCPIINMSHSFLENEDHKQYYDRSVVTDRTVHIYRANTVMLDKTTKEAHLIDVTIPDTHDLHSTSLRSTRSVQT